MLLKTDTPVLEESTNIIDIILDNIYLDLNSIYNTTNKNNILLKEQK